MNINIYTAKGGSGVSDNEPKKKESRKGEKKDGGKGGKKKLEKGKGTHDHGGNFFFKKILSSASISHYHISFFALCTVTAHIATGDSKEDEGGNRGGNFFFEKNSIFHLCQSLSYFLFVLCTATAHITTGDSKGDEGDNKKRARSDEATGGSGDKL